MKPKTTKQIAKLLREMADYLDSIGDEAKEKRAKTFDKMWAEALYKAVADAKKKASA